jgi:hypothetical protein
MGTLLSKPSFEARAYYLGCCGADTTEQVGIEALD